MTDNVTVMCGLAVMNAGIMRPEHFLYKNVSLFFITRKVEVGCKPERQTKTKDSDTGWRWTAIQTIFRALLSAVSAFPPGDALPHPAGDAQDNFCSDLTDFLSDDRPFCL